MGGAAGHLSHVFEDKNLTFADVKNILTRATLGKLDSVSEKFDGLNMVIGWDSTTDDLKIARSLSDVKSGGLDRDQLEAKFKNRGKIAIAFNKAYDVLTTALSSLDKQSKIDIFGEYINMWYSVEVIYRDNMNVVLYDTNAIIFHEHPMFFRYGHDVSMKSKHFLFQTVVEQIPHMQKVVSGWKILPPENIKMSEMVNKSHLYDALAALDELRNDFNLLDEATIEDYLMSVLRANLECDAQMQKCLPFSGLIIDRCLEKRGSSLTQIKKIIPKELYPLVSVYVENSNLVLRNSIERLEKIINDFSNEMLDEIKSRLISDPRNEVSRIKASVFNSISEVSSSGNKVQIENLQRHLGRLGNIKEIKTSIEGIVFEYKEKFYKLTGKFAAINQIMGIMRYGKLND
jgi:hypothetical protein